MMRTWERKPTMHGRLLRFRSGARIEQSLRIEPKSKPLVYAQINEAAEIASVNYWLESVSSAGIATLGLVLESPAVVIGAMLTSPLIGPDPRSRSRVGGR